MDITLCLDAFRATALKANQECSERARSECMQTVRHPALLQLIPKVLNLGGEGEEEEEEIHVSTFVTLKMTRKLVGEQLLLV